LNDQKHLFEKMANQSGGKFDRKTLEKAAKTHNANDLVKNLSQQDKQKLENILSDKEKLKKVLESPEAKMLLKLFGGTASPKNEPYGQADNSKSAQNSKTDWVPRHSANGGKNG